MNDKSHITMDCTDIKAMLSAIIDGAGDPDERHRAERHLAECATCRRLVSDAEQVDAMLAAAVDSDGPSDRLPEGFEGKVLSRTVFAAEAAHRWHSWLGWLAAAASIMLAVVMWTMDRTPSPGTFHATYRAGPELQSWALLEPPTDTAPRTRFVVNEVARYAVDTGPRPGNSRATTRSADTPTAPLKSPSGLSPLAAETIESVSMVMAMLQHADDRSFADVEHVRRITEYEKLLPHMAEIRGELPPSDRPPILAAEAMLYRIVRGPVSLEDVRELRYTIARMNLPERIAAISGLVPPPSSL